MPETPTNTAEVRGRELYEICKFIRERGWHESLPWSFTHKDHEGWFTVYEAYKLESGDARDTE